MIVAVLVSVQSAQASVKPSCGILVTVRVNVYVPAPTTPGLKLNEGAEPMAALPVIFTLAADTGPAFVLKSVASDCIPELLHNESEKSLPLLAAACTCIVTNA